MSDDLWPEDLVKVIPRTPKSVLIEQADFLGKKTKNVVQAKVRSLTNQEGDFVHEFTLVAPTIGDYEYDLFSITHGPELYPAFLSHGSDPLFSEDDLVERLRLLFATPKVGNMVRALVAQSRTGESPPRRDDDLPF